MVRIPVPAIGVALSLLLGALASSVEAQSEDANLPVQPCLDEAGQIIALRSPEITVPLDSTGIRDWSFVNPRSPFPLVRAVNRTDQAVLDDTCFANNLPTVRINFENQTSDRGFDVKFPFTLPALEFQRSAVRTSWEEIDKRCRDIELAVALTQLQDEAISSTGADPRAATEGEHIETQREKLGEDLEALSIRLEDLKVLVRREELALEVRQRSHPAASSPFLDDLLREIRQVEVKIIEAKRQQKDLTPKVGAREQLRSLDIYVDPTANPKEQLSEAMVGYQLNELRESLSPFLSDNPEGTRSKSGIEILTPLLGVCRAWMASSTKAECTRAVEDFAPEVPSTSDLLAELNPKVKDLKSCLDKSLDNVKQNPDLERLLSGFLAQSKAIDRYQTLIVSRQASPGTKSLKEICKKTNDPGKLLCDYTFTVNAGQTVTLGGDVISALDPGRITFNVLFTGEAEPPAHNQGYLATSKSFEESASRTEWSFASSLGGSLTPRLSRVLEAESDSTKFFTSSRFSPDHPYMGERLDRWTGTGSLTLKQSLGDRAQGSATLTYKKGFLGESSDGSTSVSTYTVTVFGDNFRQLRLGKYGLFTTRDTISGSLEGESFEMIIRSLSVGAFIKKNRGESLDGTNKVIAFPERAVTLSLQNLPFRQNRVLRTWTLLGAYGDEHGSTFSKLPDPVSGGTLMTPAVFKTPFRYLTFGTDLTFGIPGATTKGNLTGAFSLYGNRRWLISSLQNDLPERIRKGEGTVGLLNLRWSGQTQTGETPPFTVEARLGYGTGDDPETPNRDEGYLGEGGSYGPDLLFLTRFAGNIGPFDERQRPDIATGLSNKTYFGLNYINTRSALVLEALAALLGVREQTISRSTTVALHHYRFNEPIFGERDAGNEIDVKFEVQVPKGITTSLNFGYLFVGPGIDEVIKEEPWIVTAQVKVSLF